MMMTYHSRIIHNKGDLLTAKEGYIIHGCNAQGVMGSGVAKAIKEKYPEVYDYYRTKSLASELILGSVSWVTYPDICIINAITQNFYGRDKNFVYVDYDALLSCFEITNNVILGHKRPFVLNFPLIGCGLPNGDWDTVSDIIEEVIDEDIVLNLWEL